MFDMVFTGNRLSEARRQKDMTQMELAEKLGISFQAVSSWERGNTMPDIAKLPDIADILGVSVDYLLGGESKVANGVINGDLPEKVKAGEVSVDDIADVVPVMKPSELDSFAEKMADTTDGHGSIADLKPILPFLGRETVEKLFTEAAARGDYSGLFKLAPFVRSEIIGDYLLEAYQEHGFEFITGNAKKLLPFTRRELIGQIAELEYEKHGIDAIKPIAPFISCEKLSELASREVNAHGMEAVKSIAPFLSRDFFDKYVEKHFFGASTAD